MGARPDEPLAGLPAAALNAANVANGGVGAAAAPNAANVANGGVGAAASLGIGNPCAAA